MAGCHPQGTAWTADSKSPAASPEGLLPGPGASPSGAAFRFGTSENSGAAFWGGAVSSLSVCLTPAAKSQQGA